MQKANEYIEVPLPQYPVFGMDVFETGTGVHASVVIKAMKKGDNWLADRVYSGVPAGDFGLKQVIRIGHMAGRSNIIWWLEQMDTNQPTIWLVIFLKLQKVSDEIWKMQK